MRIIKNGDISTYFGKTNYYQTEFFSILIYNFIKMLFKAFRKMMQF